jgi:hypothetical protein
MQSALHHLTTLNALLTQRHVEDLAAAALAERRLAVEVALRVLEGDWTRYSADGAQS